MEKNETNRLTAVKCWPTGAVALFRNKAEIGFILSRDRKTLKGACATPTKPELGDIAELVSVLFAFFNKVESIKIMDLPTSVTFYRKEP